MKKLSHITLISFVFLMTILPSRVGSDTSSDFILNIHDGLLNKAISTQKYWEYKDEKEGIYLKLTDLKFEISDGFIKGKAKVNRYKQLNSTNNKTVDSLLKQASKVENIAVVELKTHVQLSRRKNAIILSDTQFTGFDNKFIPKFIENTIVLKILNSAFTKDINGKEIYKFPGDFPVSINQITVINNSIKIFGELLVPCKLIE